MSRQHGVSRHSHAISLISFAQRRGQAPPAWQQAADEKRYALLASIAAAPKPERPPKAGAEEEEEEVDEGKEVEAMEVTEEGKGAGGKGRGKKGIKVDKRTRHNKVKNNPLWVKNFHKGDSKKGRKSKRQYGN